MKDIVISLKKNELAYDIEFMTYKVAKVHFAETHPSAAQEVASAPSDQDFIDRLVVSGIENVRNELSWCAVRHRRVASDDKISGLVLSYDILLRIDENNHTDLQVVASLIHDYLVNHAVYHYLLITATSFAPPFAALAEATLNKIYLHVREEKPRRRYFSF